MKRIFFVCVEGFAKAKMDGDGFYLRLKTETEHLFCSQRRKGAKFFEWKLDFFFGTQIEEMISFKSKTSLCNSFQQYQNQKSSVSLCVKNNVPRHP